MSALYPARPVVLAAACHPDDIEFTMAGTLLHLRNVGCEIHMWNLANGCLGSMTHEPGELSRLRWQESQESAAVAGAAVHPPLFNDMEIFYDKASLAQVAATLRNIKPEIILTHSPEDYMEDHQNVCRLVLSAAFGRAMPHLATTPPTAPYQAAVRIYHAAPHGLCDGLRRPFQPDFLVDIAPVLPTKQKMLACHRSQQQWLDASQGMNAYLDEMVAMGRTMAGRGEGIEVAEGWIRHSHLGYCSEDYDPLPHLLAETNFVQTSKSQKYATTH